MRLIPDTRTRGWEARLIEGTPIGIEQLDRGCWLVYRIMFGERVYVMEEVTRYGKRERDVRYFSSEAKAKAHAREEVNRWRNSLVISA